MELPANLSKRAIRRGCYALSAVAALLVFLLKSTVALAVGLWLLIGATCLAASANSTTFGAGEFNQTFAELHNEGMRYPRKGN